MKTKTIITDKETLESLTPEEIENYLEAHGWWNYDRWGETGNFWKRHESDEATDSILVPAKYHSDYAHSVSEALRIIAEHEGHDNQRRLYYAMKDFHNAVDVIITINGEASMRLNITAEWDATIGQEGQDIFLAMVDILRAAIEQLTKGE